MLAVAALTAAAAPAALASSFPIYVNTTEDHAEGEGGVHYCSPPERETLTSEECPLRAAMEEADTLEFIIGGITEVVVAVPPGRYALIKGSLPLGGTNKKACGAGACAVTVRGAGAGSTVIEGGGLSDQMHVAELAPAPVTVENLTLAGGSRGISSSSQLAALTVRRVSIEGEKVLGEGAGLYLFDAGPTLVRESSITGNSATEGAGIYAKRTELTIVRSTLAGNTANKGGAIYALEGAGENESVRLIDSTLARNGAIEDGGALWGSNMILLHATVAENAATSNAGISQRGEVRMEGSILSGNNPNQCGYYGGPKAVKATGANVVFGANTCAFESAAPITADPRLAPLAANGGFGQTMALLAGSSAFDAAGAACPAAAFGVEPALDERGISRPQGSACDAGAFESRADASVVIAASPEPVAVGSTLFLTASAHDAGPEPLTGVQVNVPLPSRTAVISAPAGCSAAFGPGGSFTCQVGNLAPGETRTVTVQVRPEHPGALIETASVSSEQPDVKPADNHATIASVVAVPGGGPGAGSVAGSALLSRAIRFDRRGNATVAVTCPAGAPGGCRDAIDILTTRGTLPATASARRATLLASAHATILAGTTKRVRISLNSAGRHTVPRGRRASARALLTATPVTGSGAQATSRANVTLLRGR